MSVARHTLYNMVGALAPVALSIVTVPAYLSVVGLDRYGILSICWLFLGYFTLFDLGLGRATARRIAVLNDATDERRSAVFWTSTLLTLGFALAATVLMIPAAHYGLGWIQYQSPTIRSEADAAIPWLVASLPLGIITGVLIGSLEGRREFLRINIIGTVSTIGTAIFPLLSAIAFGPHLWIILAAALAARALSLLLFMAAARKAVPILRPSGFSRAEIAGLLKFGGWTTISNAVGPLLAVWDRFVIGVMISSAAIALYIVPFNLVAQLLVLPAALARALFPRLAGTSDGEAAALAAEGVEVLACLLAPLTMAMLLVAGPFLHFWLGASTGAQSAPVAYILLLGFWVNGLAQIPFTQLQAMGRPHLTAAMHLAELLPYAALLYLLIRTFGIEGAALAWALRCCADASVLFYFSRIPGRTLRPLLLHALTLAAAVALCLMLPLWSPVKWLLLALLASASVTIVLMLKPPRISQLLADLGNQLKRAAK